MAPMNTRKYISSSFPLRCSALNPLIVCIYIRNASIVRNYQAISFCRFCTEAQVKLSICQSHIYGRPGDTTLPITSLPCRWPFLYSTQSLGATPSSDVYLDPLIGISWQSKWNQSRPPSRSIVPYEYFDIVWECNFSAHVQSSYSAFRHAGTYN